MALPPQVPGVRMPRASQPDVFFHPIRARSLAARLLGSVERVANLSAIVLGTGWVLCLGSKQFYQTPSRQQRDSADTRLIAVAVDRYGMRAETSGHG